MNFLLSFHKRFWVIETICLLLIGTVVLFYFQMFSMSIALSEIISIGVFIGLFIYRGIYKHDYIFPAFSKRIFGALFIFGIYYIILSGIRLILHLPVLDSSWSIRSIMFGSAIFFIMDEYKPKVDLLLIGAIIVFSALNTRELIDCFRFSDIRSLKFLNNINIYVYVCIMLIPFAVWAIKQGKQKSLPSFISTIAYANMGTSMVIAFLSGGRLGWLVMGAVVGASFLLIFGYKWNSFKLILSFMIVCIFVTIIASSLNFKQSRSNVYRSFSVILTKIPGLSDHESVGKKEVIATTDASNNIRKIYWERGWNLIKKSPILGPGTYGVAYKQISPTERLPQPAHNFILEAWMGWGLIGLILYLIGLFSAFYYVIVKLKNIPKPMRFCCLIPISASIVVSLFQPFMPLLFPPTYIMWFSLGFAAVADHYYKPGETSNHN
ncbi:O-antigen ligase [Clostridium sp.]|uniref:O-antigen ligase family protein n=1 Tax=Clostridium sp. TaxID=1506 RepID=UPI001A554FBF|nr:O-antigen ligase family protein [Clostridium sp.]MBK5240806.1 O-antigen ligase family protein [Clostridium sp.]